jgi:hypothetical protein
MWHAALLNEVTMAGASEGSALSMWSRRIENICGALSEALGLALLGVWLFAPLGMKLISTRGIHGPLYAPASFWQLYGFALGIVLFALRHNRVQSLSGLVLLWVFTALLVVAWVATVTALPRVGEVLALDGGSALIVLLVLVPALALATSIGGTVAAGRRVAAHV